jgi:hypothetical protein
MKINEINQPKQIDEGIGSALIGDRAAAAVRGFFSGKGTKHTMYQQAFLKDFYQDAITSLDNGIRGGFVDPNAASDPTDSSGSDNTQVDPGAIKPGSGEPGSTATPKPGAAAAQASKAQQQTNQTLNNYIKQAAQTINSTTDKNQKIALTKELVNAMADRKGYPEWENALATVQQVIKRGNVDPGFATTAINNLKAGTTMTEAYKIYYMNLLVESVGLTWNDLGLCVTKKNNNLYLAEQKFVRMNGLFESIMTLTENQGVSIRKFMTDWFAAYMTNTKWESYKAQVEPMLQAIEDTYATDKGKKAIKQLAKTAFSISKLSPMPPKGAPEPPKDGEKQQGNTASDPLGNLFRGGQGERSAEQIAADAASLPKADRDKLIQQLNAIR